MTTTTNEINGYFGLSDEPTALIGKEWLPMAKCYWGSAPLPAGARIIGGYSDDHRAGALIELANGMQVCGNMGTITGITLQVFAFDEEVGR